MLRPEQLRLELEEITDVDISPGSDGRRGTVLEADFCGPVCELTVRLAGDGADPLLRVSSPGVNAPMVGARVRIRVAGLAHVFP